MALAGKRWAVRIIAFPRKLKSTFPRMTISSGNLAMRTESVSETPDIRSSYAIPIEQVDTSSEYSTAMRWPSSSEYSTAPPASSTRRTPTGSATPSVSVPVAASSSHGAFVALVTCNPDQFMQIILCMPELAILMLACNRRLLFVTRESACGSSSGQAVDASK